MTTEQHGKNIAGLNGAEHLLGFDEGQGLALLRKSFEDPPELSDSGWVAFQVRQDGLVLILSRNKATYSVEDQGWDSYDLYCIDKIPLLVQATLAGSGSALHAWCEKNLMGKP